jgi:hypothetical protein
MLTPAMSSLCERAVHHVRFAAADMETRGVCARLQPLDGDEDAGPAHLVVVALYGGYKLGIGRRPGLHPLLGFTQNDKSHRHLGKIICERE